MQMATARIAHGRMEVETDLLLGMDDVLLPLGYVRKEAMPVADAHRTPRTEASQRGASGGASKGFESELFDPRPKLGTEVAARVVVEPKRSTESNRSTPAQPAVEVRPTAQHQIAVPASVPVSAPINTVTPIQDTVCSRSAGSKSERLADLEQAHASQCPHCTTATAHTKLVFGEGNPDAELVFVGEAPGETEDAQGRPFVGRAGEKLDEMISAMGLRRSDVYIANVLKSRPPENRTPLAHEVERCGPYLLAQLSIIRPKVIITLGGPATKLLLATDQGITRMRGVAGSVRLGVADGTPCDVPVLPTFHPAYLLRNYTIETRRQVWEDLKKALTLLGRETPARPTTTA